MCLTRGALETAQELTRFARDKPDERIREADVGMTGANFVTADTETIALVTCEGNARKTVASVVVAGLEKIVSSVEDLQPFVELIGRSGTGQDITSYVSLFTPPVDGPVVDFHDEQTPLSAFDDLYESIAEHSYEGMEYVFGLLENGADASGLRGGSGERVAYHSHCQQRTLGLEEHTVAVLDRFDFDVVTADVECSGMASRFGYKSDYNRVCMAVGDDLREQFTDAEHGDCTVVASGTSCLEQLDSLLERRPTHSVELLVK